MSKHPPQTIGARLIYAREHRGKSAADLRRDLAILGIRVSRSRLWNYENRPDSMPKPDILAGIAEATGFSAGWILTGIGQVTNADPLAALLGSNDATQDELGRRIDAEDALARLLRGWRQLSGTQREAVLKVIDLLIDDPGDRLS